MKIMLDNFGKGGIMNNELNEATSDILKWIDNISEDELIKKLEETDETIGYAINFKITENNA